MIGIQPLLGRTFTTEEEQDINGSGQIVVLNASFWRRKFGSDPNIVGKSIVLGKRPVTVIGVMPAEFRTVFGNNDQDDEDLWLPLGNKLNGQYGIEDQTMLATEQPGIESITTNRNARLFFAIARLKTGIMRSTAQAEMDGIAGGLRDRYPEENKDIGVTIASALDPLVGDIRQGLLIIFGAVGFVLLIACGNVANLMLARGLARQREIAIRTALGAGRMRIIRQLLTESLLLSIFGCGLGLLIAFWGIRFLVKLGDQLTRVEEVRLDARVLLFTITVSLITGLVFGLIPAIQVSRIDLSQAVKEGSGSGSSSRGGLVRNALIVSEVALTLILLTGAGLLIQSFARLRQVNLGFKTSHVLTFHFDLPLDEYDEEKQVIFGQQLKERLESIPGVISASTAFSVPMIGFALDTPIQIEGQVAADARPTTANFMSVGQGYFETLGISLIKGRTFDERDKINSPMTVIISQAMAKRFFPDGDAIGKRIKAEVGGDIQEKSPFREIVGVVGDVRQENQRTAPAPMFYFPATQAPMSTVALVHTAVDPLTLVSAIREQVNQIDGELPIYAAKALDQSVSETIAQDRFNAALLAIFAGIALFLTGIGLYGVLAYSVTQRTREIGIRMALGAQRSGVLKMVISHGLKLALIGTVIGFAGALGVTSLISSLLFGVGAKDPTTLIGVTVIILITVIAACVVPAWRATRVDPMVALRCE
jgi:putative ABC transport system permease protein